MTAAIVVLVTCSSAEEARKIARAMVESRLAACVNIVDSVRSIYRWKEAVEEASECLLLIKSTRDRFEQLKSAIRGLHSYELPEIIALPVVDGLDAYLSWIASA